MNQNTAPPSYTINGETRKSVGERKTQPADSVAWNRYIYVIGRVVNFLQEGETSEKFQLVL